MTRTARLLAALLLAVLPGMATAQQLGVVQSPILTIESDRLFQESLFGQRVAREIEEAGTALARENRQIEAELTAEERELTERRAGMDASAFRELADAFDAKVRDIRRAQDAKARALTQQRDADRVQFLQAAAPVLERLLREAGAAVILERDSVLLSTNASDVTGMAITRIDAAIGDGSDQRTDRP